MHEFHPYFFQVPHTSGHLFISGYDNDLFTSPGDPLFYFHHAQVDRLWAMWQGMDFATRELALDGTLTMLDRTLTPISLRSYSHSILGN